MSFYAGRDKAYQNDRTSLNPDETEQAKFELAWNNVTLTSRWNRVINARLFSNSTVLFSQFRSSILDELEFSREMNRIKFGDRYTNGLTDVSIKTDL